MVASPDLDRQLKRLPATGSFLTQKKAQCVSAPEPMSKCSLSIAGAVVCFIGGVL